MMKQLLEIVVNNVDLQINHNETKYMKYIRNQNNDHMHGKIQI